MTARRERCPQCGFHPARIAPDDAAVAVRSLARRWRELLAEWVLDHADGGQLVRRPLPDSRNALERAAATAHRWEDTARWLDAVRMKAGPHLTATPLGPSDDLQTVATALRDAAEGLAMAIERFEVADWRRTGHFVGRRITAWELAVEAVHRATHDLRATTADLEQAVARDAG